MVSEIMLCPILSNARTHKGKLPEKSIRNNFEWKENRRLGTVFASGPHGRNEETGVDEGEGGTGQSNHPKDISTVKSSWGSLEYSHSIQNEELILLLHQRTAPTTSHLGNTIE